MRNPSNHCDAKQAPTVISSPSWSLRPPNQLQPVTPQMRIKSRGQIMGWPPQPRPPPHTKKKTFKKRFNAYVCGFCTPLLSFNFVFFNILSALIRFCSIILCSSHKLSPQLVSSLLISSNMLSWKWLLCCRFVQSGVFKSSHTPLKVHY